MTHSISNELERIVSSLGYRLDDAQPHIQGERAVISRDKFVLLGTRVSDEKRIVLKATKNAIEAQDMQRERTCQQALTHIHFAYQQFLPAQLLAWHEQDGWTISVNVFIEQDMAFLERSLEEQFFLALQAFELQESAHAATYEHIRSIRSTFGLWTSREYLESFKTYRKTIADILQHERVNNIMMRCEKELHTSQEAIERYTGFLTHSDFVPHNIRIQGRDLYLLDHTALRFGNKHDGWARFLNFMMLYHRDLEHALEQYVRENRAPEELESLQLMRLYRYGELVWYYAKRQQISLGTLKTLDRARVDFWADALDAMLNNQSLPESRIQAYREQRDILRSDEEKARQQGLH